MLMQGGGPARGQPWVVSTSALSWHRSQGSGSRRGGDGHRRSGPRNSGARSNGGSMSLTRIARMALLVLFSLLAAHIQSATAGLVVFDSRSAFLAAAPIETT